MVKEDNGKGKKVKSRKKKDIPYDLTSSDADLETLLRGFERHGIAQTTLDWYLDLRKYGTFPHSGFGLGVERTLAWICGLPHVRETSPFPRLPGRLRP